MNETNSPFSLTLILIRINIAHIGHILSTPARPTACLLRGSGPAPAPSSTQHTNEGLIMAISRISTHATLTMAIWMALAGTAQAQVQEQGPTDKVVELDTMVVTAQKRSENAQDVPVSISVVGADQIKDFHATQLTDI